MESSKKKPLLWFSKRTLYLPSLEKRSLRCMHKQFLVYKKEITDVLYEFFKNKQKELVNVNAWGSDVCNRYLSFATQGKMIRGCLTILGYEMFTNQSSDEVIKLAAAMEIFQSAILIHDDIMDRDTMRRGAKTMFAQYQDIGEKKKVNDALHFGESMGICVGDLGFFFAFELLANIPKIQSIVARELTNVGIAQMQDVDFGYSKTMPNEQAILNLYRYKTARYTFSLPLMVGSIVAGQSDKTVKTLEKLGENLGIIFQLKDDQLDAESDLREGKKTFVGLYGEKRTQKKISDLSIQAKDGIYKLPMAKQWTHILLELLEYNTKRIQ